MVGSVVEIVYEDITQIDGVHKELIPKKQPKIMKAYGVLAHEDKKYYKIIWNYDTEGTGHDILVIPKKNVREIKRLLT